MITIENSKFKAGIAERGAELQSLVNKADNYEYVWTGDKTFWNRHAPILFPSIGKSNQDQYRLGAKTYPMSQHVFSRDYDFDVSDKSDSAVTFTQHQTAETLKKFTFEYTLAVTYMLTDGGLSVHYTVTNDDPKSMPFALGFHPAFNVGLKADGSFDDYDLTVEPLNSPLQRFGIGPVPFRNGDVEDIPGAEGNRLPLTHDLLDGGLVILANSEIAKATLASPHHDHSITLDISDFPYLTIWSPEHKKAPFIAVEPFDGLPDQAGEPTDWYTKLGNTTLSAGANKQLALKVELH